LDLKIGSYSLVIWVSKSPRWFLVLDLKTKRDTVCRLRQKIDGMIETAHRMRRDLAGCFGWKQIGLGFFSLPQNYGGVKEGGARGTITEVA
jgi:hypothetical protein